MSRNSFQTPTISIYKQINLVFPAIVAGSLVFLAMVVQGVRLGVTTQPGTTIGLAGVSGLIYLILITLWMVPLIRRFPDFGWIMAIANAAVTLGVEFLEPELIPGLAIPLAIVFIFILALLAGRFPTYLYTILAILANVLSFANESGETIDFFILELVLVPFTALVVTGTILRLRKSLLTEMKRLQTLNRVARSLATSLDLNQVVNLVSSAIQNAVAADTYYLGLLQGETLHMELFYDDGEFFPGMEIAIRDTLAGVVIDTRDSLLVRDLPAERKKRNLPFIIVGRPRISRSWMGTPLFVGGRIAGLIAVASYQKNSFEEGDLVLLENIAQQAALALENAERHAEVETRSQHDSLTGVLNHNAFLTRFERQTLEAAKQQNPLSLIMLDIDHFKQVNDNHGHLTGDEVLTNLCQIIRRNVKKSDLIGRWGGEEFVISLPNANGPQAYRVAERIRACLEKTIIQRRNGEPIKVPTISQGIAVFLEETSDFIQTVDLADRRLYIAKDRGRNEIEPSLQALEETQQQPASAVISD